MYVRRHHCSLFIFMVVVLGHQTEICMEPFNVFYEVPFSVDLLVAHRTLENPEIWYILASANESSSFHSSHGRRGH